MRIKILVNKIIGLFNLSLVRKEERKTTKMGEYYKGLFYVNEQLKGLVDVMSGKKTKIVGPKDFFILFALGKSYKSHTAIINLCRSGYGQDAAIVVRSLFELEIITLYILSDKTDGRIKRYNDYDWIIRKEMFEAHADNEKVMKEIKLREAKPTKTQDSIKLVKKRAEEVQKKHNYKRYQWSEKSLKGMSEEVGERITYSSLYGMQSQLIHSQARAMNEYVEVVDSEFVINVGPSKKWVEESLVSAFDFFINVAKTYDNYHKLGLEKKFLKLEGRFKSKVEELNKEGISKG